MTLRVADQAELVGILVNLHGQGMQLESVARLDDTAGRGRQREIAAAGAVRNSAPANGEQQQYERRAHHVRIPSCRSEDCKRTS